MIFIDCNLFTNELSDNIMTYNDIYIHQISLCLFAIFTEYFNITLLNLLLRVLNVQTYLTITNPLSLKEKEI